MLWVLCKWRLAASVSTSRTPLSPVRGGSRVESGPLARRPPILRADKRLSISCVSAAIVCRVTRLRVPCILRVLSLLRIAAPASTSLSLFLSLSLSSSSSCTSLPLPALSSPSLARSSVRDTRRHPPSPPSRSQRRVRTRSLVELARVSSWRRGNRGSLPGVCASMLSGALGRIRVQATWRKVRWCYDSGFQARRVLRDDSSAVTVPGTTSVVSAPIVCCYTSSCSTASAVNSASFSSSSFFSVSSFSWLVSSSFSSTSASSFFPGSYDDGYDGYGDDDDDGNDDESTRRSPSRLCSDRRSRHRKARR